MLRLTRKGQSTAEYAIVIGLVIAAAVAMQVYVKRSLQAKVKEAVDHNFPSKDTDAVILTKGGQYEPYYLESNLNNTRTEASSQKTIAGGGVTRDLTRDEANRTGTQDILKVKVEQQ